MPQTCESSLPSSKRLPQEGDAINIVHATVDALKQLEQPEGVAARRGLPLEDVAPTSMLRARAEGEADRRAEAEKKEAAKAAEGVDA